MLIQKLLPAVYWIVALSVCVAVARRGGRDEKIGAAVLIVGSFASLLAVIGAPVQGRLPIIKTTIFAIDVVTLVAFTALALRTDRFWPLWATAFHFIAVTTHLASFVNPQIVPRAYVLAQGMWAYPMWFTIFLASMMATRTKKTGSPLYSKP